MSCVAITKVEIQPKEIYSGTQFVISVSAFEVTHGAGERRLPFKLFKHEIEKTIKGKLPFKLGKKGVF